MVWYSEFLWLFGAWMGHCLQTTVGEESTRGLGVGAGQAVEIAPRKFGWGCELYPAQLFEGFCEPILKPLYLIA